MKIEILEGELKWAEMKQREFKEDEKYAKVTWIKP